MRPFLFLFFCLISGSVFGQKLLQIEKLHSPKTWKFFVGNKITFQTTDGQWYTRYIEDVSYENNWIIFPNGHIPVSDIKAIRTFKNRNWSRGLGNKLMGFTPVWAVYRGVSILGFDEPGFGKGDYLVMGSSLITGALLRIIFKSRTYKFKKQYRLRVLDLNVK